MSESKDAIEKVVFRIEDLTATAEKIAAEFGENHRGLIQAIEAELARAAGFTWLQRHRLRRCLSVLRRLPGGGG